MRASFDAELSVHASEVRLHGAPRDKQLLRALIVLHAVDDQIHLIALVYPDATYVEDAAAEVANRVSAFTIPGTEELLNDIYGATVSTWVYESESTGQAVAVVEARYPLPEERYDSEAKMYITSGHIYKQWVRATVMREFFLLMVKAE